MKLCFLLSCLFIFGINADTASVRDAIEQDYNRYLYQRCDSLLSRAEEFFAATLFAEAATQYEEIKQAIEQQLLPEKDPRTVQYSSLIYCRLGQIHFYSKDYTTANSFFERSHVNTASLTDQCKILQMQAAYTQAVSCRFLSQYEAALEALEYYNDMAGDCVRTIPSEVHYEIALNNYLLGRLPAAKEEFLMVSSGAAQAELFYLSRLYLARIGMAEKKYELSEKLLEEVYSLIPQGENIHHELAFLRGEVAFQKGSYQKAITFLRSSLPEHKLTVDAYWIPDGLIYLGLSHLKLAEAPEATLEEKNKLFLKAEEPIKRAIELRGNEWDRLALAQYYLFKGKALPDPEALKLGAILITECSSLTTIEAKGQCLLLQAEIAENYQSKEKIYAELTSEEYKKTRCYSEGWYKRGLNHYLYGESLNSIDPEESRCAFGRASESLTVAYNLLEAAESDLWASVCWLRIKTHLQDGSPASYQAAIEFIDDLNANKSSALALLLDRGEIYYLQGFAACRLAEDGLGDKYTSIAEKSLWFPAKESLESRFCDECLNLLGLFYHQKGAYEKSEEVFLHLLEHYPKSSYVENALFYCAQNAEKLGKASAIVKSYRQLLFENYPSSPHAPSAYFHYHSYRDYLQGDKEALSYLKNFLDLFPNSPLTITALFLTGLDYKRDRKTIEGRSIRKKNLLKAIEAFTEVEKQFNLLSKKNQINKDEYLYFLNIRYRALLERALSNQEISEESQGTKKEIYFQYAEELYRQIFREFADPSHPLASYIKKVEPFPRVYEESLYALISSYRKADVLGEKPMDCASQQAVNKLIHEALEIYDELGIRKGYYLSRIYYEQGIYKMKNQEYEDAWRALLLAEESNKDECLSCDQKLDLWIQQAICYKALGQMDKSMLILSKVINDDAVSGQRLKAMYLRAEIYELQGRAELAKKQLEATAKKGGEWAHKAKVKLDTEYVY